MRGIFSAPKKRKHCIKESPWLASWNDNACVKCDVRGNAPTPYVRAIYDNAEPSDGDDAVVMMKFMVIMQMMMMLIMLMMILMMLSMMIIVMIIFFVR